MDIQVYNVGKKLKHSCQIVPQFILFGEKKAKKDDFKENIYFEDADYLAIYILKIQFKHIFEILVKYI